MAASAFYEFGVLTDSYTRISSSWSYWAQLKVCDVNGKELQTMCVFA